MIVPIIIILDSNFFILQMDIDIKTSIKLVMLPFEHHDIFVSEMESYLNAIYV
jgi:hypothetical protein